MMLKEQPAVAQLERPSARRPAALPAERRLREDEVAEIRTVAVRPEARGAGVGSRIVETLLDTARAPGDAPATFLLDEFLEFRTFESFPGLRAVLRDLLAALSSSGNRFVLTTRYTARALRLLRPRRGTR